MNHKYFDFTQLGGFPLNQQRLEFLQSSYSESIQAISNLIGDNVIVSGCIVNGNNVTDGWIVVNGELLPFIGGNNVLQSTFLIRTNTTTLRFKDTSQKGVQFNKFCSFGIGAGAINWDSLSRLNTIKELHTTTQVLKDQVITGTFLVNFPASDQEELYWLTKEVPGFDSSKHIGFLSNTTALLGSIYEYKTDSPIGTLKFAFRTPPTGGYIDVPFDYVLIKKQ